jgi:hypothetical protein
LRPRLSRQELLDLVGAVEHVADVAQIILGHRQAPRCRELRLLSSD